jgi:hypothetical protein
MLSPGDALELHQQRLLGIPGCTAVAVGKKIIGGEETDTEAIVVFVSRKGEPAQHEDRVPAEIEGIQTDVVEREFGFIPTATDPMERFDPLIGGVSITSFTDSATCGSVGCFIAADGTKPQVPAGTYLLTNTHVVLAASDPDDPRVIQPGEVNQPVPGNYACGTFVHGDGTAGHDCAITSVAGRGWSNEVPNHPLRFGNRLLRGIAPPAVGVEIYKFGAGTRHTRGVVTHINFSSGEVENAIMVEGENRGLWCGGGDSGSVVIRYADDLVIGLNFRADMGSALPGGGYSRGLAFPITTQIESFSTAVRLA